MGRWTVANIVATARHTHSAAPLLMAARISDLVAASSSFVRAIVRFGAPRLRLDCAERKDQPRGQWLLMLFASAQHKFWNTITVSVIKNNRADTITQQHVDGATKNETGTRKARYMDSERFSEDYCVFITLLRYYSHLCSLDSLCLIVPSLSRAVQKS